MNTQTFTLALRNILRHKMRTAMTLAAIVIGVSGIILTGGFVQDIYAQLGEAFIHSQSGHLQVAKPAYFGTGSRRPEAFLIEQPEALKRRIEAQPGVAYTMGRLSFQGLLNNGRTDFAVIAEGIEPEQEARLGTSLHYIAGEAFAADDPYGLVIGEGVAQTLDLAPGDPVTLVVSTPDGAMNTLDFNVSGVFRSFSRDYDARAIRLPLGAAQDLLATPGVSVVVVALHRTEDTESVSGHVGDAVRDAGLAVRDWRQLNDFYEKTVALYDRQFGVLQLIILIMVLLSVTNTVNMAVFERQGEFGTMRALGNRGRDVFRLIVTESLLLGAIGAVLGILCGVLLALLISAIGIPMPPPPSSNVGYTAFIRLAPDVVAGAGLVGLLAALLASLLPAWRVAGTPIVDALRQNV
ncbi:MAG TPA: ABC transporter permease [Burkholderiales bacterium]|nr:ABC transporter permease [Burkholderiales bacterium]